MTFWYLLGSVDTFFWWFMNIKGCWRTYKVSDFKVKIALQNWSQISPKSILALHNMKNEQKNINMTFWYLPKDNAHLIGESTSLVCVQLKKWDFEKIFNKSDGDLQQLLCKKTVSKGCALCKKRF